MPSVAGAAMPAESAPEEVKIPASSSLAAVLAAVMLPALPPPYTVPMPPDVSVSVGRMFIAAWLLPPKRQRTL